MTERRAIGGGPRPDAADKATGKAAYIHDLERPGMLFGRIKFSAQAHARIRRIDTARAERLPGVRAVLTGANTPEVRFGFLRDNVVLKRDKVRQFRDEVAAVAAIAPEIAEEAISLIDVEYEPLPAVFDPVQALAEDAPLVHEVDQRGRPRSSNRLDLTFRHESGNLEAGRRAARHVVEGDYTTQLIQQACMGTAGCIAELDGRQNLTIWTKTQIPFLAQRDFIRALAEMGLPGRNVRVVVPALGGAFGSGLDTHAYEYIAILLAWSCSRPVKIVYSREEEFRNLSPRQSSRTRVSQGLDAEGRLTFRDVHVLLDNGAYTSWGATFPSVMMLPATSLYRVPNVRFDATLAYTNNTYCQAMRGYGNPEVTWAIEQNLDDLAEAAGLDPLQLRLRNCNEPGEVTPMGLRYTTCGLRACLDRTAARLDWSDARGRKEPTQNPRRRGVGLASLMHVGGGGRIYRSDASGMILKLDDFGNVNVLHGGVEMGQGMQAVIVSTVAEALGVRPEQVFVAQTDTATCPWDVGTHASRGGFMAAQTAIRACAKARARIFELAETLYPVEVAKNLRALAKKNPEAIPPAFDVAAAARKENFLLRDGELSLRDAPDEPWSRVELGRLLRAAHFRDQGEMLTFETFYDPPNELPDWEQGKGNMSAAYAFGTQGAEVEVDTETGEVKILRLVAVHDVGRVLNDQALTGQVYGALAQGVGYALYEEVLTDRGAILNAGFRDYKIPTCVEMGFPIELEFVETDDPGCPFGAKGVGEAGMIPTAAAIGNAIYDAVGVRVHDLPITPAKVLAALRARPR